ncbi:hypothetical protein L204_103448 [Cryptococcus depauperatus]|nr:hypothetical protein L204_01762 [Cryptococcus depauperatus CBS 7855]
MLQRSVQLVCLQLTATVAVALQVNIPSLESGWKSEGSHMIQWQPQEDDTAIMEISITFPNVSQYSLANNAKEQDGFLIYSPNETLPEGTYRLDFSRSNLPLVNINFNVEAGEEDAIAEHPFVSAASGGGAGGGGGGRSSSGSSGSGGRSDSNSSGRNGRNTPGNNANPAGWSEPSDESDNKSVAGGAKAGSSGGTAPAQSSTGQTTVRSTTSGVPSAIVRPITTGVKYDNRTSTATEKMVIPVAIPLLSVVLGATI